jgi:hypothetical protein
MSRQLLQITFTLTIPKAEYVSLCSGIVEAVAAVPGLLWKAWWIDEEQRRAGGVYLFEDRESLQAYINGPIVATLEQNPAFADVVATTGDIIPELSSLTRMPT